MISIFSFTNAQNYQINFAGTGSATAVDSVEVKNLTQGTNLTLPGTDTLHLIGTQGIYGLTINNESMRVYPNPMHGQAELSFYAKKAGNTTLIIYDIAGKKVLQTGGDLLQGTHKYQLTGLKQGIYLIKICEDGYVYTAKLISQNTTSGEAKIKYIGNEKSETFTSTRKRTKASISMAYTTGDSLRFTGYSGNDSTIVLDAPNTSKTITFTFTAFICGTSTITDIDLYTYNTVSIGSQCWMKENLKVTHYRNGIEIPNLTDNTQWENDTSGAYCCFNNDCPTYNTTYGKLYNWHAVNDAGGICPTGWHVPSDSAWTTLTDYLTNNGYGYQFGHDIAKSMASTSGWTISSTAGTIGNDQSNNNSSGFTALPGGYRYVTGPFYYVGDFGEWWSSTEASINYAWRRSLHYTYSSVSIYDDNKNIGHSVRCIKD